MPLLTGYQSSEMTFELPGSVPFHGSYTPDSPQSPDSSRQSAKGHIDLQQENFSLRKLLADSQQRFNVTLEAYEAERDRADMLNQKCEELAGAVELANTRHTDTWEENRLLKTRLARCRQSATPSSSADLTSNAHPELDELGLLELQLLHYQAPTIGQLLTRIKELERNLADREGVMQDDKRGRARSLGRKLSTKTTKQGPSAKDNHDRLQGLELHAHEVLSSSEPSELPSLPHRRYRGASEPVNPINSDHSPPVDPNILLYYKKELKRAQKRIEKLQEIRTVNTETFPQTPISATSERSIYATSSPKSIFQQNIQRHAPPQGELVPDGTRIAGGYHSSNSSQSSSHSSSWVNTLSSKIPFKTAKKLPKTDVAPPVPAKNPCRQPLRSTPSASSLLWRSRSHAENVGMTAIKRPKTAQPHRGFR